MCRTGRAGAGVLGTLQDDGRSCVTAGVFRRTAHVQGWPEDGAGGQGMFQDDGHSCVTTGVLRRTGGVQDWLSRGRGTGNSPGGWSQMCHYRGAQEEWGCAGSAKQGQGDQEHSRTIVTAVSLQSCSGGLGVCRVGWAGGRGTRNAPGGWSQLYLCVVTCVTVTAHWPGWKGQGGRGRCH